MAEKSKIHSPFVVRADREIPKVDPVVFDTEYKTIEIVDEVEPVGEPDENGKQKYVIKKVVHESYQPIQEVIDADKDNVGVDNIIRQVLRTGDTSLLPMDKGDGQLVDITGAPENLMELKQMGVDAEKAFYQLPVDLVNGLDMQSFVNSMTQEKFDQFIAAIENRVQANTKKGDE